MNVANLSRVDVDECLTRLAQKKIHVPCRDDVRDYLAQHPDLIGVLLRVCDATQREFGPSVGIYLELDRDPDAEDEYLVLYVRQDIYDQSVMQRVRRLWTEYEPDLAGISGWLLVTTDFQSPR